MTVSVCAPYWNRPEALDGMIAQYRALYPDLGLELSIGDDGSPEPAVVPDGVVLTRLPAKGRPLNPCVPLNAAVRASRGDVVVLTNPEVRHDGPVLRELLAAVDGDDVYVSARCRGVGYRRQDVWLAGPDVDYTANGREPVPPGAHFHFLAALSRSLFERAGGFDEGYRYLLGCEDGDFLWRLHRAGARFACIEGSVWQPRSTTRWSLPHGRRRYRELWAREIAAAAPQRARPARRTARPAQPEAPPPQLEDARPEPTGDGPRALILGGAECVWEDLAALETMLGHEWDDLVIAVNDIGVHWSRPLDHWVSLHSEKFGTDRQDAKRRGWLEQRRANGHPDGYITWGRRRPAERIVQPWGGGSSGLLAVTVAAMLGCTHAVLCGVPMDDSPHFAESAVHTKGRRWTSCSAHWRAWMKNEQRIQGWVKSMNGRTRQTFGAPDLTWLEGRQAA